MPYTVILPQITDEKNFLETLIEGANNPEIATHVCQELNKLDGATIWQEIFKKARSYLLPSPPFTQSQLVALSIFEKMLLGLLPISATALQIMLTKVADINITYLPCISDKIIYPGYLRCVADQAPPLIYFKNYGASAQGSQSVALTVLVRIVIRKILNGYSPPSNVQKALEFDKTLLKKVLLEEDALVKLVNYLIEGRLVSPIISTILFLFKEEFCDALLFRASQIKDLFERRIFLSCCAGLSDPKFTDIFPVAHFKVIYDILLQKRYSWGFFDFLCPAAYGQLSRIQTEISRISQQIESDIYEPLNETLEDQFHHVEKNLSKMIGSYLSPLP